MNPFEPAIASEYSETVTKLCEQLRSTAADRDADGGTPHIERDCLRKSGLLQVTIPLEYGGSGGDWVTALAIVRAIGTVDSSIAHILAYHYMGLAIPHFLGSAEQKETYYRKAADEGSIWANAMNPRDLRTRLRSDGEVYSLSGTKSFCSGSVDCEYLPVTATSDRTGDLMVLAVPTSRDGVRVMDDWNCMGQRQTDSGTVEFVDVEIHEAEIIRRSSQQDDDVFATLRVCLNQIAFTNIYVGIALGAFNEARDFASHKSAGWTGSGVNEFTEDPYILRRFGEMLVSLSGATALTDQANSVFQTAWNRQHDVSAEERARCAIAAGIAKSAATDASLSLSTEMFDVMGTKATLGQYRFDRFWRNARTFTLHDPIDYKLRDLGNWALNGVDPRPGFYS